MSLATVNSDSSAARRWLALVLLLSLCLNCVGIRWGLPNAEGTWAADSLPATAPMAIGKHFFAGDPRNSGWFYFKYPLGHPLMALAAQAPYLAWLKVTGEFKTPVNKYPYGFRHPEHALTVLALIMRVVSAIMGVGLVALAYVIAAPLFGSLAGLVAAVAVAGCYPMVFYAHTANVDVPLLFWIALAIAGTMSAARERSPWAPAVAGAAAAMAMLTKEQAAGAIAALPLVWLLARPAGHMNWNSALRQSVRAFAAAAGVTAVVGNLWWNPAGYVNRWRFLLGTLPAAVRDKYAPYQFQVQVPKGFSLAAEITRLFKIATMTAHVLTVPVLVLCLAGMLWALWRRPREAALPLALLFTYYLFSLRATALLQIRYTMPFVYVLLLFGGVAVAVLVERSHAMGYRRLAGLSLLVTAAVAVLPGAEIDRLLLRDSRYAAEAWLRAHVPAHARVEVYEPLTYLPRFQREIDLVQVPVEQRTVSLLQQRQSDVLVLSSGGRAGLTGHYVRDWQPGKPIIEDSAAAKEFFNRLNDEQLGYRRVAHFQTGTWWVQPRINSLNPEITIFAHDGGAWAMNP